MPIRNEKQSVEVSAEEAISVTVDASDLAAACAEPLRNIISRYGRPVSARAFADFQQPTLADLAVQLYQMGFTLVHCPSWPNGDGHPKSIVSDVMAQDLRDQLEQLEGVETYLLVATSRDYIAVANALKRHEVRVVVAAEEAKVCRELRTSADEFVALPTPRLKPARYGRAERLAEVAAPERLSEPLHPERSSGSSRGRRSSEAARAERTPEPARPERAPEPSRPERGPEPARPVQADTPELIRLPSDAEVLAEVKRIVAAEGICTPRRLARALCPVDRTPTGELRSRIANRIQALIDSGKLLRERLVVGGTSVETILVREERNGRDAQPVIPEAAPAVSAELPPVSSREPEGAGSLDPTGIEEPEQVELAPQLPVEHGAAEADAAGGPPGKELDAFVESVLRSAEFAPGPVGGEGEPGSAPPELPSEPAPPEPPKRSRPRRRSTAKTTAPEGNGTA